MRLLLFLCFTALTCYSFSQSLTLDWAKSIGNNDPNGDWGNNVGTDNQGNVYFSGDFSGTVDIDPTVGVLNKTSNGGSDCFVVKLDNSGSFIWGVTFGGSGNDYCSNMFVNDVGELFIVGDFVNVVDFNPGPGIFNLTSAGLADAFLLKLDGAGNFLFGKSVGNANNSNSSGIAQDAFGNIFWSGLYSLTMDLDPGPGVANQTYNNGHDVFLIRLDAAANFVWGKSFGGASHDYMCNISIDGSGNIYVTGFHSGPMDADPSISTFNLPNNGSWDVYLNKIDSNGNFVWARCMGSSQEDVPYTVQFTSNNDIVFCGYFNGTMDADMGAGIQNVSSAGLTDMFIERLDQNGNLIWMRTIGSTGQDYAYDLVVDASDNIYVTGGFSGTVNFNPSGIATSLTSAGQRDAFIASYNGSGVLNEAVKLAGPVDSYARRISINNANEIFLTGVFQGTVDFDPGVPSLNLTSNGAFDAFFAKFVTCVTSNAPMISSNGPFCVGDQIQLSASGNGIGTYQWTGPNGFTSSLQNPVIPSATTSNSGVYTLVFSENGCSSLPVLLSINVDEPITVNVGPDLNVCINSGINLNATTSGPFSTGTWGTSGTGIFSSPNSNFTTYSPSAADTIAGSVLIFFASNSTNACSLGTDSLLIQFIPSENIPVSINHNTCFNSNDGSVIFNANPNNYSFTWLPNVSNSEVATNLSSGSYSVSILNQLTGCSKTYVLPINNPAEMQLSLSSTPTNCDQPTGSATVVPTNGQSPHSYLWTPSLQTTPIASGLASGSYSVQVMDANGCFQTGTVMVNTYQSPSAIVSVLNPVSCTDAADGALTVSNLSGNGPFQFQWLPTGGNASSTSNLASGSYELVVTDVNGCFTTFYIDLENPNPINVSESIVPMDCGQQNGSISLNISNSQTPIQITWSNGGSQSTISNLVSGPYYYSITDGNGCGFADSVVVSSQGNLNVSINAQESFLEYGDSTELDVILNDGNNHNPVFSWNPTQSILCSSCMNTLVFPTATTEFTVTVTDSLGCVGTASELITVEIICDPVFIPTLFTPNNDGQNDIICVKGNCVLGYTLFIYNRWGQKVYEGYKPDDFWDGNFKGQPCEMGAYGFQLEVSLLNGETYTESGIIQLIR